MWDRALTGLLNFQIRSYLMPQKSHRFASFVGGSGVGIVLQMFLSIYPCKSFDADRSCCMRADVTTLTRRCDWDPGNL
jgi:hypothetical protein